jgi:predicted transcriptional regulator
MSRTWTRRVRRNIILDALFAAAYLSAHGTLPTHQILPMTRRSSQRALAREIYREMVAARAAAETQTPFIPAHSSPDGERSLAYAGIQGHHATPVDGCPGFPLSQGRAEGGRTAQNLTEKARALYEHSAVPVVEIARLAGVTERTVYKYAAKENWTPRYRWSAAGGRPRGARWRQRPGVAPVKGAGGRFIRRADKGKAFAAGLKAADPRAAAQAGAACGEAERLARAAEEEAEMDALHREYDLASNGLHRAMDDIIALQKRRAQHKGVKPPADDALERALATTLRVYMDWRRDVWEEMKSHWHEKAAC